MRSNSIPLNGKLVTVIADGVEVKPNSGIYSNAQLVVTDAFDHIPSWYTKRGIDAYRAALVVRKDGIVDNMSVVEAIQGGSYDNNGADGITIRSTSDNFAALICEGGTYSLRNVKLDFDSKSDGSDNGDFDAFGAVIVGFAGSKIVLDNVDIFTRGVSRTAVFVDSDSHVLMRDSKMRVMGGKLYAGYRNNAEQTNMVAPPWVLGITGNARGTNMMGDCGTLTLVNCDLAANEWGVLSTDSGSDAILTVVDSTVSLLGKGMDNNPYIKNWGSGYGSYIIDDAQEFFRGVTFNVGTYVAVVCGGTATYESSNGVYDIHPIYFIPNPDIPDEVNHFGKVLTGHDIAVSETPVFESIAGQGRKTVIHSDGFGWMAHEFGTINILDGTEVNTEAAVFLHKAGNMNIHVDNAVLRAADNVLIQLIDNDDDAVGFTFETIDPSQPPSPLNSFGPIFNTEFNEPAGYPGIDYPAPGTAGEEVVNATFTNVVLNGDCYNASGYVLGGMGKADPQGRPLNLTLGENAVLSGAVCATSAIHVDETGRQNTHFTIHEYYYLGRVANRPHFNGANTINVTLTDNAVWNVTGTSIITSLTIGEGARVNGRAALYGQPIELVPGQTYTGLITIEP